MKRILRKLLPEAVLNWYHWGLAFLGALVYGFPSQKMTVIGVTGTDGKSTTVEMITRILAEAGLQVASTSSVRFQIGERTWKNTTKMGMPGRLFLQRFLRRALREKCAHAVIEVSSEGILQNRHKFISFDAAVFTNLSPEHIERHGSFDAYRNAKLQLFHATKKTHVINRDDESASYFLRISSRAKCTYGFQEGADLRAENVQESPQETRFFLRGAEFKLQFLGRFNVLNALAAIGAATSLGISLETCKSALEKAERIPGRMNVLTADPFTVIVDYAVTPRALEGLYQTIQRAFRPKRTICVLGSCGGGRDKWKRRVLGRIAGDYCAEVIVTNEDPYDENPEEIIRQVAEGVPGKARMIGDRREALRAALSLAAPGDVVVATGKGSEDAIAVSGGRKIPWDESKVLKEELEKLDRKSQS